MEIVCHHCKAINRVPDERLHDDPVCGACKKAILPAEPIEVTLANFDVLVERSELPVVIDFWATWCAPCRAMAPMFADAAKALQGRAILGKLDTDAEGALAARFGIRSIPTIIIFKRGSEVAREMGTHTASQIVSWVESF